MGLWITLLCVDEVWELRGVTNEEDRSVVEHPVQDALVGLDLDSKA